MCKAYEREEFGTLKKIRGLFFAPFIAMGAYVFFVVMRNAEKNRRLLCRTPVIIIGIVFVLLIGLFTAIATLDFACHIGNKFQSREYVNGSNFSNNDLHKK